MWVTAGPRVAISIPARSHTFVEIDNEIILLPFHWIIQEGLLSVTSESLRTKYWLTACSSLPRKKCGRVNWPSRHDHDLKQQNKQKLICTSVLELEGCFILENSVDLMKCHILWHFIWVFSVCQSTHLRVSSIQRVMSIFHMCWCGIRKFHLSPRIICPITVHDNEYFYSPALWCLRDLQKFYPVVIKNK